jgi:hypothetical protein
MARPAGGNVHMVKAVGVIVVSLVLGFIVLNDKGSSGFGAAAAARAAIRNNNFTETSLPHVGATTTSTTTASERQPAQIKVIAINATGTAGKAGQATTRLRTAGYNVLQPGNATAAITAQHPPAAVYYAPGYQREALTVAALFSIADASVKPLPNPSPSADIRSDTNIAVLVGKTGITL